MPNKNALITYTQGKSFVKKAWNIISETGLRSVYPADPTDTHGSFKS